MDAMGLLTNIPETDGLEALEESLEERSDKTIHSGFLLRLMELILKYSIFTLNSEYFQQQIGAAMGSKPVPGYSNIFKAKTIDKIIKMLAEKKKNALLLFFLMISSLYSMEPLNSSTNYLKI